MKKYDVVGIGNAVVDIISPCDDRFLEKMGIEKGIMQLIEKDRSEFLYNSMGARTNAAGGSVANTVAGISSLGGKTAFVGRVSLRKYVSTNVPSYVNQNIRYVRFLCRSSIRT